MVDAQQIGPKSVVVLAGYQGDIERLALELAERTGCDLVISLAAGETLRSLDEDAMRRCGWQRVPS